MPLQTALQNITLEEATDVIAEILIGPEFAKALEDEHARSRRRIAIRYPEFVYTEDVETPDGYPCCELIAVRIGTEVDTTAQNLLHEISAQWTVNGDDSQVMGRELKRLVAAMRNLFKSITLLPHVGGSVWCGETDFGPVVVARGSTGEASDRFVKSASVEVFWRAFAR